MNRRRKNMVLRACVLIGAAGCVSAMSSCRSKGGGQDVKGADAAGREGERGAGGGVPGGGASEAPPVFVPIARIDRVTLASGLVIEELRRGTGALCVPDAVVKVRYTCRVEGGEVFDSSGGEAMEYALGEMIRGWREGLPGMLVGGERRLRVPPELGYGARELKDADGNVLAPAQSVLVYEVELVEVK